MTMLDKPDSTDTDALLADALPTAASTNGARPPTPTNGRRALPDPRAHSVDPRKAALGIIGYSFCQEKTVLPISLVDGVLEVAHYEDTIEAVRTIRRHVGSRVHKVVIHKRGAASLLPDIKQILDSRVDKTLSRAQQLINDAFLRAANLNASDILFEPEHDQAHLRFDCEGIFTHEATFSSLEYEHILSILGPKTFKTFNARIGQKGNYSFDEDGRELNLRGASWPRWMMNRSQPKLVYRVLVPYYMMRTFDQLGMQKNDAETFLNALRAGKAGVLVTGRPGMGKTTTLYSALIRLKPEHRNVYAIEDPCEIYVPWIWSTELTEDWTHSDAINITNRLNPTFVFVGEALDQRSAVLTLNATLASVPCATAIHAADCVESIDRAISLGVERDRIARGVTCILAQMLMNPLCPACSRRNDIPTPFVVRERFAQLGLSAPETIKQRVVSDPADENYCDECNGYGVITPRIAIFEVVLASAALRALILSQNANPDDIANVMYSKDHLPLIVSGIELLKRGEIDTDAFMQIPTPYGNPHTWA